MLTGPSRRDRVKLHHGVPVRTPGDLWVSGLYHSLRVPETTSGNPAGHGSAWYDIAYGLYTDVRHGHCILVTRVIYVGLAFMLWHDGGLHVYNGGLIVRVLICLDFESPSIFVLLVDV